MYKIFPSYLAITVFWLFFFQWLSISIFSQTESNWSKPFSECWNYKSDKLLWDKVASDNKRAIFVLSSLGTLTALNIANGETLWNADIGGDLVFRPYLYGNSLYLLIETSKRTASLSSHIVTAESNSLILQSIDISTGLAKREKIFRSAEQIFFFEEEKRFVFVHSDGTLTITEPGRDDISAKFNDKKQSSKISAMKSSKQKLLIGTEDKEVILFSIENDAVLLKRINAGEVPDNIFWDGGDIIVWSDRRGFVNTLNLKTSKIIWKRRSGAAISEILITPVGFLVSSLDNFVYLLSEKNGDTIWKRRFGNKILGISLVEENVAVVVPFESETASVLNIKDGKVLNSFTLSDAFIFLSPSLPIRDGLIFSTTGGVSLFTFSSACGK